MGREFPMRSVPRACYSIPARESLCTTTTLARAHHKSPRGSAPWVPRSVPNPANASQGKRGGGLLHIEAVGYAMERDEPRCRVISLCRCTGLSKKEASSLLRSGWTTSLRYSDVRLGRSALAAVAFPSRQHSVLFYGTPSRAT
jgi:hypothetical protein